MNVAPRGSPARHAVALVVAAVAAARCDAGEPPPVAALAAQLAGEHCHYRAEYDRCTAAPLFWLETLLQPRRHTCVWWAARCLEQRGPAAAAAVPALVAALRDGPNDFDTGDGVIAARSAVPVILPLLADEALADGCLPALAALGPAAAPAVPALAALVAAPSGAVRDGQGIHYGVRASSIHHRRLRAVEALAAVGDELAFAVLAKTLTDSEIGPAACRALRRLDPEGGRLRVAIAAVPAARLAAYRRDRFQTNLCLDRRR